MDYSKTIIYKIVCNDLNVTDVYVGHTTNMVKRRCFHKSSCNNENSIHHNYKVYQTIRANGGWDNWSMIQICEFPCNNQEQARAEERKHYELLNASLNMIKPMIYESEKVEYDKEYRAANKEKKVGYDKEYRAANRDTILEKHKEYYEANKDKIAKHNKELYNGNRDTILEKHKEYYEANKDKIAERGKIKYTCGCGSTIRKYDRHQHERSHKHLNYVKQNPQGLNTD